MFKEARFSFQGVSVTISNVCSFFLCRPPKNSNECRAKNPNSNGWSLIHTAALAKPSLIPPNPAAARSSLADPSRLLTRHLGRLGLGSPLTNLLTRHLGKVGLGSPLTSLSTSLLVKVDLGSQQALEPRPKQLLPLAKPKFKPKPPRLAAPLAKVGSAKPRAVTLLASSRQHLAVHSARRAKPPLHLGLSP
jgi:hypothetical protein